MERGLTHRDHWVVAPDGARLEARTYAPAGEPRGDVLLVHGLGGELSPDPWALRGTHQDNEALLGRRLAARGFRVLLYGQRGHGRSEGALGIRQSVDDLLHVARSLDGARRYGIGVSFGGYALLQAAAREPGLFEAIAPIAAPPSLKDVLSTRARRALGLALALPGGEAGGRLAVLALKLLVLKKQGKRAYLRQLVRDRGELRRVVTHLDACRLPPRLADAYADLLASPALADLAPITTPTLLVVGEGEDLVHGGGDAARAAYLRAFRERVADLTVQVLPGAGHAFTGPDGRSLLEHDPTLPDALAAFFRRRAPVLAR